MTVPMYRWKPAPGCGSSSARSPIASQTAEISTPEPLHSFDPRLRASPNRSTCAPLFYSPLTLRIVQAPPWGGRAKAEEVAQGCSISPQSEAWVLLHGTPLTPHIWREVAGLLASYRPVICPPVVPIAGETDPQAHIAARLLSGNTELPERMHVVGHSFGGQVALDLTLLAPERVATLTLICTRDTPFVAFAAAAATLRRSGAADIEAALTRWFTSEEREAASPTVDLARRCLRQADPQLWATALDGISTYDRSTRVATIRIPTHLVAAELDPVSSPAAMSGLAGRLPHARLTILPGAGHMSAFVRPAALARLITSFALA